MKLLKHLRSVVETKFNKLVKEDKCQSCGSTENLHMHHVYPLKDMMMDTLYELGYDLKEKEEYSDIELFNIKEKILGKHLYYTYKTLCFDCHIKEHGKKIKNKAEENFDINEFYIEDYILDKWLLKEEIIDSIVSKFNMKDEHYRNLSVNKLIKILYMIGYKVDSKRKTKDGIKKTYYKISNFTEEDNKLYNDYFNNMNLIIDNNIIDTWITSEILIREVIVRNNIKNIKGNLMTSPEFARIAPLLGYNVESKSKTKKGKVFYKITKLHNNSN